MRILVDEPKRRANMLKHGIDLDDAAMFDWAGCFIVPARGGRSKAIGRLDNRTITIIFRRLGTEGLSVISMRPASRKERRLRGGEL